MARLVKGDRFPNLAFHTAYKEGLHTADVLGKRTVFYVLRYIGCTVCRLDTLFFKEQYAEFEKLGVQLFVVMQSDRAHVRRELNENPLPYELICDEDMSFYRALDISPAADMDALLGSDRSRLEAKGTICKEYGLSHGDYEGDELQLPAYFIVAADGTVSRVHYGKDLMDMPTVEELLQILRQE